MTILAFDTATGATTVALSGVGDVVYTARDDSRPGGRPGHATRLLPLTVTSESGFVPADTGGAPTDHRLLGCWIEVAK